MFWDITSFLLLWGAALFSPATPLGEGITAPPRNESPVVTAPAQGGVELPGGRPVVINPPPPRPVCNLRFRC
jgi:hypothetical protein